MEVAYAAFCGIGNILIPGPRLHNYGRDSTDGLIRYARAIQEALEINGYIQIAIHLPMSEGSDSHVVSDVGDLSNFARDEYLVEPIGQTFQKEEYGTWDTWNVIRTICKYNARLSVGKCLVNLDLWLGSSLSTRITRTTSFVFTAITVVCRTVAYAKSNTYYILEEQRRSSLLDENSASADFQIHEIEASSLVTIVPHWARQTDI